MAQRFGWPIELVPIRCELYSSGGDFHPRMESVGQVSFGCSFDDLESSDHREDAEKYIPFGLAGSTAEYRFRKRSQWSRQTDVAAVSRYLWAHAPEGDEAEYLQVPKVRAGVIVDEVWSVIEAIVAALVEQWELSGAEVEAIGRTKSNTLLQEEEDGSNAPEIKTRLSFHPRPAKVASPAITA